MNEEKMLSEKNVKTALYIIVPVVIAILSFCLLANKIPDTRFIRDSLESVEGSKETVMEFTAATLATSVAISALPDDFGSPLADSPSIKKYGVSFLVRSTLYVTNLYQAKALNTSDKI